MEQRNVDYYFCQPNILHYCLKAKEEKAPELLAIALAIADKRSVTLKPEYQNKVYIYGQVGIPPKSTPEIEPYQWIETSWIESVYFEKVYRGEYIGFHCYIVTQNTIYRLFDTEKNRLTWMHFLLEDIQERELTFRDFIDYFSDIDTEYRKIDVID